MASTYVRREAIRREARRSRSGAAGGGICATRSAAATGRRNGARCQPSEERAPEPRGQPRGEQHADPARGGRHRRFLPDGGELAERRLGGSDRVLQEPGLGEQRLRAGVGEHQVDRLPADRQRGGGRGSELVRLGRTLDRVGVAEDRRCPERGERGHGRVVQRPLRGSGDGGGGVHAQDLLHHRVPRRLLGGEIRGETAREQRGDGRGGERHGRDVDQRRCHRLAELRQQRVGVGGAVFAPRNPAAVRALVAVRHPGELIEQGRLDDQVDRADLLPARQPGQCGDLRAEGSGRCNGCLEVGVDQQPVRVERDAAPSARWSSKPGAAPRERGPGRSPAVSTTATWEPPLRRSIRIG